ncbi:MAG: DAK2 domain-containing protein [Acidimicrobiales bacterium]
MLERLGPAEVRSVVCGYRDALRAHQERLNRLNVYPVPDGDTGTNMALTLESVVAEMGGADDMAGVCKAVSHGSLMGARGNSGVILSQILRGLTERLRDVDAADGAVVAEALGSASAAAYTAVMRPVEGTMLTVVRECANAAQVAAKEADVKLVAVLEAAATAGADALERTPTLLPVLAEAGVVDAGGAGFLLLIDVLLHVTDGRPVPESDAATVPATPAAGRDAVGDLRYEVMFFLEADAGAVDAFKQTWTTVGDSIAVVGGDGLWNCHIHTDDIGGAIEAGIEAGKPSRIRVTDLMEQVAHEQCERDGPAAATTTTTPTTASAVVAVGAGEGAVKILRSLGATGIVAGGQSMNPSTGELLKAIDSAAAAGVIVLPNNKNVIPVAQRAAEMAGKLVRVVPTTSIAEGFAALMGFDAGNDPDANAAAMAEAADNVSWGEVTWAVRDASTPSGPAKEGDHLGLLGHDIVAVERDLAACACALLDRLVHDDHELVTVVEGTAATSDATAHITAWLAEHRPAADAEVHRGDQPLSAYLFSAE